MKHNYYLPILALSFLFIACKKTERGSGLYAGTTYKSLGNYDKNGLPNYLLPKDVISPELTNFMAEYLVNGKNLIQAHPELFTNNAIADVRITKPSTVYMTFVQQGATNKNALAFYTYPTDNPPMTTKDIGKITYALPNVGPSTSLQAGDKVSIGTFSPGTSIGFILMINAWDSKESTLNNSATHYTTNYLLNPEKDPGLRKHAVLIEYPAEKKVMVGFEDMNREDPTCDHDFNDTVFYVTVINN